MMLRPELAGDEDAIRMVTEQAFRCMPYSDQTEHLIIDRLRKSGMLSVSLVAEDEGQIIGHVGFSPVILDGDACDLYGLGPLSVLPARQKSGVGSALVKKGLSALTEMGAVGCVVAGDPAYYRRLGFDHRNGLSAEGVTNEYFMFVPLQQGTPSGIVRYHPAFFGDIE